MSKENSLGIDDYKLAVRVHVNSTAVHSSQRKVDPWCHGRVHRYAVGIIPFGTERYEV